MGTLRILLALWVVAVHGDAFFGMKITQGWAAVQCFFIISGFYMSLILNEKYTGSGSVKVFLSQRFFRLLPTYWAVLLLTLAVTGLAWGWWGHALPPLLMWQEHAPVLGVGNVPLFASANILLLGHTELLFLGMDPADGSLHLVANFLHTDPWVWRFTFIPQAWSIELELLFYVLAPFLVRRPLPVILGVMALSFAVRGVCYVVFKLTFDPWTYRFFPNELALFLMGAVSYRIYRAAWRERLAEGLWLWGLYGVFFLYTLGFSFIPLPGQIKAWPYYGLATVTIPFLFAQTKNWRWDRYIGELSYPVYLIHFLVVWICEAALPAAWQWNRSLWAMAGSLLLSLLLSWALIEPLERWRAQRAARLLR